MDPHDDPNIVQIIYPEDPVTTSATTQAALADPPPTVFERLGEFIVRRARLVLVLFFGGVIVAGVVGSQVFAALGSAGYNDPGSDSAKAATVLSEAFATFEPILVMAVTSPAGVDDPAATADARELVAEIRATPGVAEVVVYLDVGHSPSPAQRGRLNRPGDRLREPRIHRHRAH